MAATVQITFDTPNPDALARFWAQVLGYKVQDPPEGFSSWPQFLEAQGVPESEWDSASAIIDPDDKGPRLFFQKLATPKPAKNRVHLDITVSSGHSAPIEQRRSEIEEAAARLCALGATRLRTEEQMNELWIVMQDPEGNEFCIQ